MGEGPFGKEAVTTDNTQRPMPEREELFAAFCAHLANPWEAARRAGFEPRLADAAACSLLDKAAVRRRIKRHEKALEKNARSFALRALLRLAGYNAADGVKLASSGEDFCPGDVERLDLFGVSSLKWSSGSCEVKFFDRIRALDLLLSLDKGKGDACPSEFYRALRESAAQSQQVGEYPAMGGDFDGD